MWDYRLVCLHIDSLGVMTVVMEHSAPTFYHGHHYQVAAELDTGDSALCLVPCLHIADVTCYICLSYQQYAICGLTSRAKSANINN